MAKSKSSFGNCFGCFIDMTFQFHGNTDQYDREVRRYVDALAEEPTIYCRVCSRTVRYEKTDGKYTEVEIHE